MKLRALLGAVRRRLDEARPRALMGKLRGELFVLVHPAGTDAAALATALNRHPALLCHADALGPLSPAGFAGLSDGLLGKARDSRDLAAFRTASPETYLYKYVFDSRGRHAVGFKVEQGALLDSPSAPVRNALMQDRDVRVIHYAARNLLGTHVAELKRGQGAAGPVTVAPQAFLLQARQADRMNDYVDRLFEGHRRLKLDADRFASPERGALLAELAGFLGLDPFPAMEAGAAAAPLRGQIANAAELAAALAGTPYAWMLEP